MLDALYDKDPYSKEFTSKVISCQPGKNGYEVVLEDTAFYPEGGGQPGDTGSLNGNIEVIDTKERDGRILHICKEAIPEGTAVTGKLDWQRRFRHMQQHTGEHILSGIIHQKYGYDNVGFHMGKDFVSVDFNGMLTPEQITEIEECANAAVFADQEIRITYPSPEELKNLNYRSKKELTGQVRIVEVLGSDICACCGTHVKRTGEVGLIKVTRSEHYKGGIRLYLQIGWSALEDYGQKLVSVQKVSVLLSAKPELIGEAVERIQGIVADQKQEILLLKQQLMEYQIKELPEGEKIAVVLKDDPSSLRSFCEQLLKEREMVAVLTGDDEAGYKFVLGKKEGEFQEEAKQFREACEAKGGGKGNMIQGSAAACSDKIFRFLEDEWGFVTVKDGN